LTALSGTLTDMSTLALTTEHSQPAVHRIGARAAWLGFAVVLAAMVMDLPYTPPSTPDARPDVVSVALSMVGGFSCTR
jgi:hypothetical protein